jgi:predicted acyltransferase
MNRLLSLDVMRGLTIAGMILVNNPGDWGQVYAPLLHADWHGCTPTDWVFPFFLFMVGVAIPLAIGGRKDQNEGLGALYRKILVRSLIIFGLGLYLAAFPKFRFNTTGGMLTIHYVLLTVATLAVFTREILNQSQFKVEPWPQRRRYVSWLALAAAVGMALIGIFYYDFSNLRIPGVLQRIALVYLACGFLFLKSSPKGQLIVATALLFSYWALMTLVPVPGGIAPNLEAETNLGAWFDRTVLSTNHLWSASKTWDPEGFLSTLPAIGTGIAGMLTGEWLRSTRSNLEKVSGVLVLGVICLALGLIWNEVFPLNKKIWTSSYVVYMAGVSLLTLGAIMWLVDIKGWQGWIYPFRVMGVNALFAFVLSGILAKLSFMIKVGGTPEEPLSLSSWIYQSFFVPFFAPKNASLGYALLNVLVVWLACWVLYRRKIFIKV